LFHKASSNRTETMHIHPLILRGTLMLLSVSSASALEPGEQINLNIRGVDPAEQQKVSGPYRVGETGGVRLPFLKELVQAKGLSPEQFARAAEAAYQKAGIYTRPAIEVDVVQGGDQRGEALIGVAGHVKQAGERPFRKDMTIIQAIDAAGGRNEFGGRNIILLRDGKLYILDFTNLTHKNIRLMPGDSLQIEQKGIIDRWRGNDEKVKELLK
jgi:protein involved in polysaccharide export with SLBB domain